MVIDLSNNKPEQKKELSFKKTEEIAILQKSSSGWTTELKRRFKTSFR